MEIALGTASSAPEPTRSMPKLPVLDGWRGISILVVLAAHMLPLGPGRLQFNKTLGEAGMGLFFALSGFLITSTLYFHPSVRDFAIRRFFRIVPVAWLFMLIVLPWVGADSSTWSASLLFYANLPPYYLLPITGHLWSLCLEVQFYVGIGLLFAVLRQRSLALLPLLCVAVTANNLFTGHTPDINTLYRVDDILAGGALAYLFHSRHAAKLKRALHGIPPLVPLTLLVVFSHPAFPTLSHLRPYCAAAAIGASLFRKGTVWHRMLVSRPLGYVAGISYALYVWHPLTTHGWFDPASKLAKYARRPLGVALSFLMAHVSTFYLERPFIALGKRLCTRGHAPEPVLTASNSLTIAS